MITDHPIALTIAGSDCSAGAGIQADLKTFLQHKVHGLTAVTSVVAETPLEVRRVSPIPVPLLQDQIHILLETYPVDVIKIGLLPTRASVIAVAEILQNNTTPSVLDPVMVASAGSALSNDETTQALCHELLSQASLVTPNIPEAEVILNRSITTEHDLESAAHDIADKHQTSCLLKGGHLAGNSDRLDVLWHNGNAFHYYHPTVNLPSGIHGTGCTLSSAIAANIALKLPIEQSVEAGISYVQKLIVSTNKWRGLGQDVRCLGW
ncbi:MAG: bifunctional hydroxymethylpyrimidine kinase/phosphomethylpyrimidine kinase [Akkermansiaceae bacterium]|nr:bifunctional hydroxymethylpyrimidine kinase/phosphomethylpyrimidine kinase [Akkermansiaceae bacterium]